jgi:uncharacterized protein YegP (UPF0339 family)
MNLVVKKIRNGQYQFLLVTSQGQVVANSASRTRRNSATETIASIRDARSLTADKK